MSSASTPPRASRARKLRNALLASVVGVILALLGGELLLRLFLFCPNLEIAGIGKSIRQPEKYCDGDEDDDYWILRSGFQDPALITDAPGADPVVGWTGSYATAGDYKHFDEPNIRGRKLVLLYGDSFAQCNTPPDECFQSIMEHSELAEQYCLLNYGVGGYGLDQIYLLLKQSIDRFTASDPIVIVSLLLESDLERTILSFRDWPKPRLDIVGDRLVARGPVQTNARKYVDDHRLKIKSYLWRFFLFHRAPFMAQKRMRWRANPSIREEKERLNRRILVEIEHELSSRHLKHFYLLFHAEPGALEPWDAFNWQEHLVHDVCTELSIPLVDTRPYLAFASFNKPVDCAKFYGHAGTLEGHHNSAGNLVCFEAIRQGLREEFDHPNFKNLAVLMKHGLFDGGPEHKLVLRLLGRDATVIAHGPSDKIFALEATKIPRILMRGDIRGTTRIRFDLEGTAKRFKGRLHTVKSHDQGCASVDLGLAIEVDGVSVFESAVPDEAHASNLDIDLSGKQSLVFIVDGFGGASGCDWVSIDQPSLE